MNITHRGWEIVSDSFALLCSTRSVRVKLEFAFSIDDQTYVGTKVILVSLHEFAFGPLTEDKIVKIARRELEDYFDGHDQDDENLFSDCFDEQDYDGLTPEQEISLQDELSEIEEEFSKHRTVSESSYVSPMHPATSGNQKAAAG